MKCPNCGTEFFEGLFCPECGTKVVELTEEEKKKEEEREAKRRKIEEAEEQARVAKALLEKEKAEAEVRTTREKAEAEARLAKIKADEAEKEHNEKLAAEEKIKKEQKEAERAKKALENAGKKEAIISLVCGIISLLTLGLFVIPEILGIIFAFKGKKDGKMLGMAKAGLICCGISVIIAVWAYTLAFNS